MSSAPAPMPTRKITSASRIVNPRPLVFLHIPKTAGASVIQVLDNFFDLDEIAPAYNPPDFEVAGPARLYRGHMYGRQADRLSPDADRFTVGREPLSLMRSMFGWMKSGQGIDSWDSDSAAAGRQAGDEAVLRASAAAAASRSRDMTFEQALESRDPAVRSRLRGILVRTLTDGAMFEPDRTAAPVDAAVAWLRRALAVGLMEDLPMALWTLCDRRGWPAPAPLPEIHAGNAVPNVRNTSRAVEIAAQYGEFEVYAAMQDMARRAAADLERRAGGRAGIPAYLDRRFEARFFESSPVAASIDYVGAQVLPGFGWGFRHDAQRRHFGATGSSTLLARVEPGRPCLVLMSVHARPGLSLPSSFVSLSVDGKPVPGLQGGLARRGRAGWLLSARAVADGRLRLRFTTRGDPENLFVSRLRVKSLPGVVARLFG